MTRYADLRDEISHIRKVRKPWLRSDSIFIWRPWPTSKRTLGSDFEPVWAWLQGAEPRDVHKVRFPRSFWDNQIENKGCSLLSTFDRILIIERTIFVLAWSNIKRSWTEHGTGEQLSADIHLRKRVINNFELTAAIITIINVHLQGDLQELRRDGRQVGRDPWRDQGAGWVAEVSSYITHWYSGCPENSSKSKSKCAAGSLLSWFQLAAVACGEAIVRFPD